jgi:rSAM/selenodomain-associated transferase 2
MSPHIRRGGARASRRANIRECKLNLELTYSTALSNIQHPTSNVLPLSIIIPTLNEEHEIAATLAAVARIGRNVEVIVVDGGSTDRTAEIASSNGVRVLSSGRGRGLQLHNGAMAANGEFFLFLHADTILPPDAASSIISVLGKEPAVMGGNFRIRFDGESFAARFLTWLYPKLRKLGLYYGDSAIFVRATAYSRCGGFKPLPLFEDLDFVNRLKPLGRLVHLPAEVTTSSRRFEGRSFALTFAKWSLFQALYWAGVDPCILDRLYAPVRSTRRPR